MHTPLRRTTALASLALVLAPVLSSCGFDYATDRENNIAATTSDREGQVDVLGAGIVVAETGEAVFIASFSNNSDEDESSLESVSSPDGLTFSGFEEVTVEPHGFVNLAESETPVTVEGDLEPGSFVDVTLDFSHGESSTVGVPVHPNCGYYAEIPGVPAGDEVCEVASSEDH
jgi:hypothetical protein